MGNKYIVGDLYVNDSKVVTEDTLPTPAATDAGKFLIVDENGNYVLKTIPTLEGVMI